MAPNPIEAGVGGVWVAPQVALGTPTAVGHASVYRLRLREGGLRAAKTNGSEEYVDGQVWADPVIFTDTVGGAVGEPTLQAQIVAAARMFAYQAGVDVVTGGADPYTHTIALGTTQPSLLTWWQTTGSAVGPAKYEWSDAKIAKLAWSCSQDAKVAHLQASVLSLTANTFRTPQPTVADDATDPLLWTQGVGEFKIDTVSTPEVDSESVELDSKLDVHRGDAAKPICFIGAKGEAMSTFSAIVTDATLPIVYNALFASTTPSDGTQLSSTPTYVALASKYTSVAAAPGPERSLAITRPRVEVKPDDFEQYPRAENGKIPVTFGGLCRKSGATSPLTAVAKLAVAAALV